MKSKKSADLTLSTIAVAALVLAVIIISVAFLTSGSQRFAKTIGSCDNNGGQCVDAADCDSTPLSFECTKPQVCCQRKTGFV
ncbi:MAG: hypothetical protein Q8R04_06975 [Nanoarchaeota archaeon]|nr:hypothetical protein [Nanoarchaeota archaeon]